MTAHSDLEEERHQPQRSVVVPVARVGRGVEHAVAQAAPAARFARARWPTSVSVPDLEFPPATGEPKQCRDRAPESGGRRVTATGLRVPDPQFPPITTPARQRLSGSGPLNARGGGGLDPHRRAGESGAGPLRWGHCPDDGRLHLLQPAAVAAATAGHAQALCGQPRPGEGLTLTHGSAGPLCLACITGIVPPPAQTPTGGPLMAPGPGQPRTA